MSTDAHQLDAHAHPEGVDADLWCLDGYARTLMTVHGDVASCPECGRTVVLEVAEVTPER